MTRIAFFDLTDLNGQPLIYILEKSGDTLKQIDTIRVAVNDPNALSIEKPLVNMEESYLSIPLTMLSFRIIELPFSDMKRIREVLPFELDNLILGGAEGVVFDACILSENKGKYKILIAYIMKDTLSTILDRLKPLNIDVRVATSIDLASNLDSFSSEREITSLLINQSQKLNSVEDRLNVAIREVNNPTINLRRGEFAYTGDTEKTKKSLRFTMLLAVLLLLLFLSDMSLKIISTKKESSAVRDEIRKTYQGVFPNDRKITSELYQIKAHLKELKDKEAFFVGVSPLQFFLELASVSRRGISFSDITIDKERIIMKGESPSLSDVQQLKTSLERFLQEVSISDTKPLSQNRTIFTIAARGRAI